MSKLTFTDTPTDTLTFQDNGTSVIPSGEQLDARVKKMHYALGPDSPGEDQLYQDVAAGNEGNLRQQTAVNFDQKQQDVKQQTAVRVAQTQGGNVSTDQLKALSTPTVPTDPNSVFEQIYAGKFVGDISQANGLGNNPEQANVLPKEQDVATGGLARYEYFKTQAANTQKEWDDTGWLSTIKDYAVSMVPFLPWWRQAEALDRPSHMNFMQGSTIADNVRYLYLLPFDQAKAKYAQAMQYFKESGNTLDALTFANAVVSYGTSDEYLGNLMSIADYSTVASPIAKLAGKALGFGSRAAAASGDVMDQAIKRLATEQPTPEPPKLLEYWGSNRYTQQPDLFGEQPTQGSFRFMNAPEQSPPPFGAGLPPGKLRAAHVTDFEQYPGYELPGNTQQVPDSGLFRDTTGKIRRSSYAYKQGELPLQNIEHQGSLDLGPPIQRIEPTPPSEPPASQPVQQVRRALADGIKATEGSTTPDPEAVLAGSGNVREGGFLGALKRIANPISSDTTEWSKHLPTFTAPDGFYKDSQVIGRAYAQNLIPHLLNSGEQLINQYLDLAKVSRLSAEQLQVAKSLAETSLKKEFGVHNNDAIINVGFTPAKAHPANIDTVHLDVGMPDATLFSSKEKAALYRDDIYKLGKQAEIVPQGSGFKLRMSQHVDETHPEVQAVFTPKDVTNSNPINQLLGKFRSAEDIMPMFQRENRQIAVHAPQELKKVIRDFIDNNIGKLSKQERRELQDTLRENRDMPSATNPTERGRWYDTAGDFEQAFFARHKHMPSEKQIVAYDQFKRLNDFEWITRNLAVYRDKARQGIQQFRFTHPDGKSGWFEGKQYESMPWENGDVKHDAGIWLQNSETGQGTFFYKFNMTADERKWVDELTTGKGYRVVQVFDPKAQPLEGIGKTKTGEPLAAQVNYIITNTWEKSPLSWKQVDYRPGGHSIYRHNWYVVAPDIRIGKNGAMTYYGDKNLLNFATQAQAKKYAERLDYARKLLKAGQTDTLNEYIDKNLPHTRDQFLDLFRRNDSPVDAAHPIVYKEAGHNSIETIKGLRGYDGGNLIDATKNPHDLSNFMDKSYLMDRDNVLKTVLENDGILKLADAEQLDPYIAANKAMGQAIRNLWMTDAKISAVEKWMREFGPAGKGILKPSQDTLESHPLYFLYNPQYIRAASTSQADLVAAEAARKAIVNFIGSQTELSKTLDSFKMRLLNTVYKNFGDGKMLDLALSSTADPVHFFRGVAFHSKLGMFNPIQFFVQSQTMFHSIAIAGLNHGTRGFAAAPLIRWLGHNPDMLDAVAGVAGKLGWKPAEFKEMYNTLRQTGLYQVAGEAALRDDAFDPHLFRTNLRRYVLDAGAFFFNEGERMNRLSAFATSFREWRAANPLKTIGDREIGQMMRRADDLSANMTRASNAAWQTGIWSIPTQFFTYNLRIMEQLLGGRLTGAEKFRMMATYSALYGIPIGVGASVGGVWPVYDSIKQEAFKRGINLNEGWSKVATEGLLAQMMSWVTGRDYNVAQRYGPGNQQVLYNAIYGDKSIADLAFGASGTIAGDLASSFLAPIYFKTAALVNGTEYPLKTSDWWKFFRNISTVDAAYKSMAVLSYGKWITKTGTAVSDAEGIDAAMAWIGLSPRGASDAFLWQNALRGEKDNIAQTGKLAAEQYRFGLQAAINGDVNSYHDYMKRVQTIIQAGDLNYAQRLKLYKVLSGQGKTLADKVKWDALRVAPNSLYNTVFDNFIRKPESN